MSEHPGFEPLEAPDLDNLYDEERESVVERVDRYADLVFDDDEPEVPLERREHRVVAVLVTHNGARWLPPAIATIDRMNRRPDLVVAVDTGSDDASGQLVTEWLGAQRVVTLATNTSFGAAVAAGVAHADTLIDSDGAFPDDVVDRDEWFSEPPVDSMAVDDDDDDDDDVWPDEQVDVVDEPAVHWVWLLHDDCAPAVNALQALLDASDTVTGAAVIGPKVLGWHDRRLLLENGVTVAASGRRVTGLERGELDQGQHDGLRDVLAVGSAGMLVRRDVWDALGGFDPSVRMFRDDVDFGWRANAAGYRVIVATDAEVHHAEAGIHGRRPLHAVNNDAPRVDRESAMHVLLAHTRTALIPLVLLRLVFGSVTRGVGLLLLKAPDEAADEFGALGSVLLHPGRIAASRRLTASTNAVDSRDLAGLRPRFGSQLRHAFEAFVAFLGGTAGTSVASSGPATAGPSEDEAFDDSFDDQQGRLGFWVKRPALLLAFLLTLVCLISVRAWFAFGLLEGGSLLPAPSGIGDLWDTYAQGWHEVGPGASTAAPPYLMVVGVVAAFLLGNASRAVDAILMVGIPVAGVVMYLALRRVVDSRVVRVIAAAAYALLPAAVGAVATGRLGTVVFLILLPAMVRVALRAPVSWRAAWGGALLLAIMMAFVPLSWPVCLLLVIVAIVWARGIPQLAASGVSESPDERLSVLNPQSASTATTLVPLSFRSRGVLLRLVVLVLVPLVLLVPWSLDLVLHPASWFLQAGLPGPIDPDLAPWQVALLDPGGPAAIPVWFTVGIVALGIGGLLRRRSRSVAIVGWIVALLGLTLAIIQSLVQVRPASESLPLLTWPGPATIVFGLGLIVACAVAADGIGVRLAGDSFSWRQPAAAIAVVAAIAAPLLTAGWWAWHGVGDTVVRGDGSAVPAFVAAQSLGADRPRSLVFRPSDRGIEYALIDGEGPRLGAAETGPPAAAYDQLNSLVADLMAGRGGGEVDELGRYGVRFVVLVAASPELVSVLDSEPGLRRISTAEGDTLWRLDTDSDRVRALAEKPPVTPIAAGSRDGAVWVDGPLPKAMPSESVVVLAERSDPSWRASLDGVALALHDDRGDGWRQSFTLSEGTGTFSVWFDQEPRHRWLWLQGLLVSVVIVLALPGRRRPTDDPDADIVGDDDQFASVTASVSPGPSAGEVTP